MTSYSHMMSPFASTATSSITYDKKDNADDNASVTSETTPTSPEPMAQFPRFKDLPAELRHQIWRFAVPTPGINFFNVHCFPNDHEGCNRSTSPPWLYLDLRRLDIQDEDEDVFFYDPSAWQARSAVRRSCTEARLICALPESKAANITLTRPKRGLCVRAGDGQLWTDTPGHEVGDDDDDAARDEKTETGKEKGKTPVEPVVHRTVTVHIDDILCLSVENCSFNLPAEENPMPFDDIDDLDSEGWAYDPQLTPDLPHSIPADRLCAGMARCSPAQFRTIADALFGLLYGHLPDYFVPHPAGGKWSGRLNLAHFPLMFDALTQEIGGRELGELTPSTEVVWDRFGDCYVRLPLPWRTDYTPPQHLPVTYAITKVWPETNDMRDRYLRSALLHSTKRPARPSS
ncbi:hypothetical protein F4678DRAFT_255350 [Xylaria arbuscula]|nr:hypothetical protein F4678DRAFT_255350 [Xylaria arbuscula]